MKAGWKMLFYPKKLLVGVMVAAVALSGQAASAAGFIDGKSGFAVDPPLPFVVSPAQTTTYDVAVVINSLTGTPSLGAGDNFLCQVGYKSLPGNADFAQDDINLQVEQPEWLENAAAKLSGSFEVTGKATFVLNGATGVELIAKPKDATHAAGIFISMIDTPAGRTTLNCATRPEEIDGAIEKFRLIRAAIIPPGTTAK
jgi:hypothetical protein